MDRKENLIKRWLSYKEKTINDISDHSVFWKENINITGRECNYLLSLLLAVTLREEVKMEKTCDNCGRGSVWAGSDCLRWSSEATGWVWISKSNPNKCGSWKESKKENKTNEKDN